MIRFRQFATEGCKMDLFELMKIQSLESCYTAMKYEIPLMAFPKKNVLLVSLRSYCGTPFLQHH